MEARDALRTTPLLDACQVAPEIFAQILPRLSTFMEPVVNTFHEPAAAQHANTSGCGRLSDVERQNLASMAERFGPSRLPLPGVIGWEAWAAAPLRQELIVQVHPPVGPADGGLGCAPAGVPTSGREAGGEPGSGAAGGAKLTPAKEPSTGAMGPERGRPWGSHGGPCPKTGRQRKRAWTQRGCPQRPAPTARGHPWAWERRAHHGASLPHRWLAGDDALGRPDWFWRRRAAWGERYGLAGPAHTAMRALARAPRASRGRGRRPQRPGQTVEAWSQALADEAWRRIDVRAGRKGPLVGEVVNRRVGARTHRHQQGADEMVGVRRSRDRDNQQGVQGEYSLSTAAPETPLGEVAQVAKAAQRSAAGLQRSKSAAA
jgi:hypothetical protein